MQNVDYKPPSPEKKIGLMHENKTLDRKMEAKHVRDLVQKKLRGEK